MIVYLPPSKTQPTARQVERFNVLYGKVHERLGPATAEEHSLCNEVVVALWFYRLYRGQAQVLEKELKKLRKENPEPAVLQQLENRQRYAARHARMQKNFAWRRRGKFFDLKTERENRERRLLAA